MHPIPSIYIWLLKSVSTRFMYSGIRNLFSLLAHERNRFAPRQWELLVPTGISIPPLRVRKVLSGGMLILRSITHVEKYLPALQICLVLPAVEDT